MRALTKKFLPLTVLAIAVTSVFSVQPAQAYTVTLEQMGSNVVATGSGAFNLSGLTAGGSFAGGSLILPLAGDIATGATSNNDQGYGGGGVITGPSSFGSGGLTVASSGTGDLVGFATNSGTFGNFIVVPHGYVSGSALSDSATYNNATFASLGLTPGTYEWTWGTAANQNFTLIIGPATVPDAGSTLPLLGCALLGLAALRRKLTC